MLTVVGMTACSYRSSSHSVVPSSALGVQASRSSAWIGTFGAPVASIADQPLVPYSVLAVASTAH